jgi:hypothetical protein
MTLVLLEQLDTRPLARCCFVLVAPTKCASTQLRRSPLGSPISCHRQPFHHSTSPPIRRVDRKLSSPRVSETDYTLREPNIILTCVARRPSCAPFACCSASFPVKQRGLCSNCHDTQLTTQQPDIVCASINFRDSILSETPRLRTIDRVNTHELPKLQPSSPSH